MHVNRTHRIATEFWARMATNDCAHAAELFADGFTLDWPQSGERIASQENFVALNVAYPAKEKWTFDMRSLLVEGNNATTRTVVSDGEIEALVISFFETNGDRIQSIVEYWPDSFPAPQWRQAWVMRISAKPA